MIYEYECTNGHQFEVILTVAEHTECRECPECRAGAIQVFRNSARPTKIHSQGALCDALEKRSLADSQKHMSDNLDRLGAGEKGGNSMYNRAAQERMLKKKGVKID